MFNCPHDQEIVHLCNEYPSKQCGNSFPLDWVFHAGLSLGNFPDIKTATKILFLHSRRSWTCWPLPGRVLTGSLVPHPHPRQCWGGQVSRGVRKWHLRTCWFIITHRRVKLTTWGASGIAEKKMAPPFLTCLPFSRFLLHLHWRLLNHLVEECTCYSEKAPAAPDSSVHCLWIDVLFFLKPTGLVFSFWLFF